MPGTSLAWQNAQQTDRQTDRRPFFQVGLRHGILLFCSFSLFSSICGNRIWELPFLSPSLLCFLSLLWGKEPLWERVAFLDEYMHSSGCLVVAFSALGVNVFFRLVTKGHDAALPIPLSEAHWRSFSTEAFETLAVRSQKPAVCCRDLGNCF